MKKNVMFISSAGGHLEQLLNLKMTMDVCDFSIVTEKNPSTEKLKEDSKNIYFIPFFSRQKKWVYPFLFLNVIVQSIQIFRKISPEVIVTTGAGGVVPMCIIGKLMNRKIIYIETFSRIDTATLSGKICYRFSDVFIIQWESLKKFYPKAIYLGSIY